MFVKNKVVKKKIKKIKDWKKLHNLSHLLNFKMAKNFQKNFIKVNFGIFGLKAISSGFLTFKQIEAARRCIARLTNRNSKIWIRIYPKHVLTKKSKNSRMGKGVGNFLCNVYFVKEGTIIFEINRIFFKKAYQALFSASKKLPLKLKIVKRKIV